MLLKQNWHTCRALVSCSVFKGSLGFVVKYILGSCRDKVESFYPKGQILRCKEGCGRPLVKEATEWREDGVGWHPRIAPGARRGKTHQTSSSSSIIESCGAMIAVWGADVESKEGARRSEGLLIESEERVSVELQVLALLRKSYLLAPDARLG